MDGNSEFANSACAQYEAGFEDYLDGALDRAALRKMSQHLAVCRRCSDALQDATAVNHWLRQADATPDPGPAFTRNVMARIRFEQDALQTRAGFWEPFVSLAWKFATTSALVLFALLTYASHNANTQVADVAAVAAPVDDASDLFVPGQSSVPATRWELMMPIAEFENGNR